MDHESHELVVGMLTVGEIIESKLQQMKNMVRAQEKAGVQVVSEHAVAAYEQIKRFVEISGFQRVLLEKQDADDLLSVPFTMELKNGVNILDAKAVELVKQGILLRANAQMLRKIMEGGK